MENPVQEAAATRRRRRLRRRKPPEPSNPPFVPRNNRPSVWPTADWQRWATDNKATTSNSAGLICKRAPGSDPLVCPPISLSDPVVSFLIA